MFKNILVPIDGSHTSFLGLNEAITLAKDQKASLCLLHVVDEYALVQTAAMPGALSGGADISDLLDTMRENGKEILAKAESEARKAGVATESVLIENLGGFVAELIVEHARKCGADLIVLGTHGRRGIRRLALGSDAEQVVRMTPVPVLLVRSRERPPAQHEAGKG